MLDVSIERKTFAAANGRPVLAIEGMRFCIPDGELACLVGPSGCGKTTALRLILGLDREFEGRITVPTGRSAAVFQEPRLLPWRTARQNVSLALPEGTGEDDVAELFAAVGLTGMEDLYPGELSLGMARRVALARALAIVPMLLLLDEPFVSLDEPTAMAMRQLLVKLHRTRQMTVLMITHDLAEAAELADRIVLVSARPGRVLANYRIDVPPKARGAAEAREIVAAIRAGGLVPSRQAAPA